MDLTNTKHDRLIKTALEGLVARQRTIADNVANVDTPEFKASRVSFETQLKQAIGSVEQPLKMTKVQNAVAGPGDPPAELKPSVTVESDLGRRNDGNNVDIDREMLELADTNVRYNALVQVMSTKMAGLRYAINDGRR
ncbi:MAG TPA: flagellar basal body rod protein FlgB [Chloroflexota bacterium]|nr:flagellar basal body rod protein FlgB [Chloroflexota bacterium]